LAQGVRRGQIFAPIHWTEQVASDARIGKVVNPVVDAISGEPEFKHTPVAIQPFHTTWQGVLYVREGLNNKSNIFTTCAWWAKSKLQKQFVMKLPIVKVLIKRKKFKKLFTFC
jgi:assimilatory nitrate reductase catalytic subunit